MKPDNQSTISIWTTSAAVSAGLLATTTLTIGCILGRQWTLCNKDAKRSDGGGNQGQKTLEKIGQKYLTPNNTLPSDKERYLGGDKVEKGFARVYEEILAPFRSKKDIYLLEVGVWYGKSLAMWADWFESATIVGVDVSLKRFQHHRQELLKLGAFQRNPIQVFELDTSSLKFAEWIRNMQVSMDIVIDDGNHSASSQWKLFALVFPLMAQGGVYIVEDIVEPDNFFIRHDVGFAALLAAITNFGAYKKAVEVEWRTVHAMQKRQKSTLVALDHVKSFLDGVSFGSEENAEKTKLQREFQKLERGIGSLHLNEDDKTREWGATPSEQQLRSLQKLAKDINRAEVRGQQVIFYKK